MPRPTKPRRASLGAMRLEGIHHVTAITGDAPRQRRLLRAACSACGSSRRRVNQDDPTVYHLFYADEKGAPGRDITFFEYPGARRGPRRRRDGAPRRLARRPPTEALDFWARAARRRGRRRRARRRLAALRRPRGPRARARRRRDRRRAADRASTRRSRAELALQGFDGVRAYASDPEPAAAASSRRRWAFAPHGDGRVGGARRAARRAATSTTRAERARRRRRGHRPPRRLGLADGRPRGLARARRGGRRVARRR